MVGVIYDFIGRPALDTDEPAKVSPRTDTRAPAAKNGDNVT
jgi:hypothetical protein